MKPKDKGVCGNKECDRPIDRTFQRLNQTQTNYCSIYCNRYVKEGLKPIKSSGSKYHKNLYKFPIIKSHCENCGGLVELKWQFNKSNKHFCTNECRNDGRKKLPKRRGGLLLAILKLIRDNGREWWTANDIAKVINDKQNLYTTNGKAIGNHMKYLAAKDLVVSQQEAGFHSKTYQFNNMYREMPLVPLLTQTLK
tara:strand:- start:119 stop:703 length:585 start_codon:yes stop_codon:yes gene_type:complete